MADFQLPATEDLNSVIGTLDDPDDRERLIHLIAEAQQDWLHHDHHNALTAAQLLIEAEHEPDGQVGFVLHVLAALYATTWQQETSATVPDYPPES